MSTSQHKNWKGCALCKPNKMRGKRGTHREAWRVIRRFGTKRRFGRRPLVDS